MSIFSIGLSGLSAAQNALSTNANNVANVHTPGYHRQQAIFGTQPADQGVMVRMTERAFDRYVENQLGASNSRLRQLELYEQQIDQINNLLGDEDAGLAPLMRAFFDASADLSAYPADPAARQGVIGAADTLATQFRSFDRYLADMSDGLEDQLRGAVGDINASARQIAQLNGEISRARALHGEVPGGLLDQRDQLVAQMREQVDLQLIVQDGSSYNISVGNGQPLVAGDQAFELRVAPSQADPGRLAVQHVGIGGHAMELRADAFAEGRLGALTRFQGEVLEPTRSRLGQLAASFALAVNEVHQQGYTAAGDPAGEMFALGQPRAVAHGANTSGATISAAFDAGGGALLTGSDYALRVVDAASGEFEVTRLDTGEQTTEMLSGGELNFGGVVLTVSGALANGDRFTVQPTRGAAAGLVNLIHEPGEIAASDEPGEAGNNSIALQLQQLQSEPIVGGATVSGAYAALVSDIGNRAHTVQINHAAQGALTEQLTALQQSKAGVNLDEEAANLLQYQQFYQANARVIQVAANLLDALMDLR